ncbi:MAG TPA: glycosyltransferase [Acidimicrobiales bacterium]|nr:glycosyltransferase [Acidimicrobiales bacterium]
MIPAHDEEAVIGRLLVAIGRDAEPGEVELVVACNGCRDRTAEVARSAGPKVNVIEVERASKIAALNAGDAVATLFPRFYIDADVIVTLDTLRRCAAELVAGPALCVSPRVEYDLTSVSPAVSRFYRVWQQIPYFSEQRIGAVYGLSAAGRARFDRFPELIADDQFVQQTFQLGERRCLTDRTFTVLPPRDTRSLLLNRTRIYRGNRQLAESGLAGHGPPTGSGRVLARLARHPRDWPAVATYVGVNLAAKRRARRPFEGWERDETSRGATAGGRPIGYVVSQYPARSHTFILREVRQLRELGAPIETFSIHATPPDHLLSPQDREEAATTTSLRPVSVPRFLAAHSALALRHPGAYASVARLALAQSPPGLRARLWQMFYFAEAVLLYRAAARRGVRHLHAHLANAGADVAWLAAELGRRADPAGGWRWSFTMHGPTEFFAVERFNLARKVRAASLVVCISEYCRSQLMLVSSPEDWEKLYVVHCGVDTSEFSVSHRQTRRPDRFTVLCVGRLTPEKGQTVLLDAAAHLVGGGAPVHFIFAGWGPSLEDLQGQVQRLGITDRVTFAGAVGQDRLADLFASADAFCLPSFAEGVPIVLMEAMASGVPVVTTPIAGIPELVRNEESGVLVPPGRADLLATALQRLLDDPVEARRLAANGRMVVEKEFDLAVNCRRLREVLEGRA